MDDSYCAGGAWTIGYKAWGSLLGRRLSKHGVLVYCLDYRNFPQASDTLSHDCPWQLLGVLHCSGHQQVDALFRSCISRQAQHSHKLRHQAVPGVIEARRCLPAAQATQSLSPARLVSNTPTCAAEVIAAPMQGTILDMMRDVNTGIRWILNHTQFHGGDPEQVYLVGQSCGAQLAAMSLITQVTCRLVMHALPALHLPCSFGTPHACAACYACPHPLSWPAFFHTSEVARAAEIQAAALGW